MIDIVYEDDFLLVAAKAQGMSIHPAPGVRSETLVEWLRRYFAAKGFPNRHVAAVSRLDRGTSGLVLVVTDPAAHPALHRQIIRREVRREYQCLIWGRPLFQETTVDIPLGRRWDNPRCMAAYDLSLREAARWDARAACTHLTVSERYPDAALLTATLETGRMHQIRVHCQYIRHPIVGDPVYRGGLAVEDELEWQCLHAGRLQFRHPITGEMMSFEQGAPESFAAAREALRSGGSDSELEKG